MDTKCFLVRNKVFPTLKHFGNKNRNYFNNNNG